jgi:hypothetical protein
MGMVFGIVGGRRDMLAIAVSAQVEEHAPKLTKLSRYESPDAAVAAVAMQA